ncbi:hypothetical protein ALC56_09422 [Trachymyrmex septentrionalis]|uniref:Uncharacterized protein n=1 Tax=Trachymyrmex septentrionalis TaxID=34720 RepID=A0A195F7V2_9HYME|nr:hypothetical protein ALC56_09422 [Trachymyrmex septentrionalis]
MCNYVCVYVRACLHVYTRVIVSVHQRRLGVPNLALPNEVIPSQWANTSKSRLPVICGGRSALIKVFLWVATATMTATMTTTIMMTIMTMMRDKKTLTISLVNMIFVTCDS